MIRTIATIYINDAHDGRVHVPTQPLCVTVRSWSLGADYAEYASDRAARSLIDIEDAVHAVSKPEDSKALRY